MREVADPGDLRIVVRDEAWKQLRLGPEAVKSFDADLRLSRTRRRHPMGRRPQTLRPAVRRRRRLTGHRDRQRPAPPGRHQDPPRPGPRRRRRTRTPPRPRTDRPRPHHRLGQTTTGRALWCVGNHTYKVANRAAPHRARPPDLHQRRHRIGPLEDPTMAKTVTALQPPHSPRADRRPDGARQSHRGRVRPSHPANRALRRSHGRDRAVAGPVRRHQATRSPPGSGCVSTRSRGAATSLHNGVDLATSQSPVVAAIDRDRHLRPATTATASATTSSSTTAPASPPCTGTWPASTPPSPPAPSSRSGRPSASRAPPAGRPASTCTSPSPSTAPPSTRCRSCSNTAHPSTANPSGRPAAQPRRPGCSRGWGRVRPAPPEARQDSLRNPPLPIPDDVQQPLPGRRRPLRAAMDAARRGRHGRNRPRPQHRHQPAPVPKA